MPTYLENLDRDKTPEAQVAESKRLLAKYPDRIPVLVDRRTMNDPTIDKNKYLVPNDMTFSQFLYVIRKRLDKGKGLNANEALFYFVNNQMPPQHMLLSEMYRTGATNGYIRVIYSRETAFGAC